MTSHVRVVYAMIQCEFKFYFSPKSGITLLCSDIHGVLLNSLSSLYIFNVCVDIMATLLPKCYPCAF